MVDPLAYESFLEGAKKAAHKAMDDHGRREYDEFALHAGVAVERLAKAALVSKNPIYIVEMRGSAEMLFHLGGHRAASKVRTIGAGEAISRLRVLGVLSVDRQLDLLIDLRNGVAHSTGGEEAKSLLATLARTVGALQEDLGEPLQSFWGRWIDTARIAVDHQRERVEREVEVRIRQALHRFEDRFAGLPKDVIEQAQVPLKGLRREWFASGIHKETGEPGGIVGRVPCPACTSIGLVMLESVDEGIAADIYQCGLCGLTLEGPEEFEAARICVPDDRARLELRRLT